MRLKRLLLLSIGVGVLVVGALTLNNITSISLSAEISANQVLSPSPDSIGVPSITGTPRPTFPPRETNPLLSTPVPIEQRTFIDDPEKYQIVYLSAPDSVNQESLISPTGLLREYGHIDPAYSWQDVMALEAQDPIQAIIVHESAYDLVDREWMGHAVRQGVVVATINMHHAEFAELIDSECARKEARSLINPFEEGDYDYYYVTGAISLANDPAEQPLVDSAVYDTCGRDARIKSGVRTAGNASHASIAGEHSIGNIIGTIVATAHMIDSAKVNHANRHLPATDVPPFP